MLNLSVPFAAFFISLWVSDAHSPKTWAFYACDNSRALTPVPVTLDYKVSSRVLGGHLCCSSDLSLLKVLEKWESKEQKQEQQEWATGSHEGEKVGRAERESVKRSAAKQKETYSAFCKTFGSAHFWMSKPKSQPSGCYLTASVSKKQPNISISFLTASPSPCFAADQWTWAGVTTPEKEWESAGIQNAPSQAKPVISP